MNRRKLFGALAGAAALPFVRPQKPAEAAPLSVWDGCEPMTEAEAAVAFGPGMVTRADLVVKLSAASSTSTATWSDAVTAKFLAIYRLDERQRA